MGHAKGAGGNFGKCTDNPHRTLQLETPQRLHQRRQVGRFRFQNYRNESLEIISSDSQLGSKKKKKIIQLPIERERIEESN